MISGETEAVSRASVKLLEAGALRVVPVNVSGPFHSLMLKEAGEKLLDFLSGVEVKNTAIPFVSNVTAEEETGPERIKELLGKQVYSPVRWQQSVEYMISSGADTFVEIGPGKPLSGFIKRIDSSVKIINVEGPQDLEKI